MLPGMDGVEVIRQIRAWPEFKATPILVIIQFLPAGPGQGSLESGATKCVSKMDCTPNLALELVEQMLSGEDTGFTRKFGKIALPKGALESGSDVRKPAARGPLRRLPRWRNQLAGFKAQAQARSEFAALERNRAHPPDFFQRKGGRLSSRSSQADFFRKV